MERCTFLLARCAGSPPATAQSTEIAPRARAHQHSFVLSAERLNGLRDLAKSHKTSLNVLLLDLYARTLAQVPGLIESDELLVRIPIAARNTRDRTDCWVLCGCFSASGPLPSSIDPPTSIEATHRSLRRPCQSSPYSLLWRELQWNPAELMELNQVILNLEQTIAIQDDGVPLGSTFNVEPIADEGEGPDHHGALNASSMHPPTGHSWDNGSGPASLLTKRPGNAA